MNNLPGIDPASVPESCTCTYRPFGDRGPLAQRLRRIVESAVTFACPIHREVSRERLPHPSGVQCAHCPNRATLRLTLAGGDYTQTCRPCAAKYSTCCKVEP